MFRQSQERTFHKVPVLPGHFHTRVVGLLLGAELLNNDSKKLRAPRSIPVNKQFRFSKPIGTDTVRIDNDMFRVSLFPEASPRALKYVLEFL